MDLNAYMNIDNLDKIAQDNGIVIPRLRGYRLMRDEEPYTKEDTQRIMERETIDTAEDLCRSHWHTNVNWREYSSMTDWICKWYLIPEYSLHETLSGKKWYGIDRYIGIRWDRIHGKKRKDLKFAIKKAKRAVQQQHEMWNKYVGRDDVLYIHSRMGGGNWKNYKGKKELMSQPWFLDRVDDAWDGTYCDFYAKIKPVEVSE